MAVTRPRVHTDGLAEAIGLGADELAMRKSFLEFGEDDVRRLEGMHDLTLEHVDSLIEAFYDHLLSFPETAGFFRDPEVLEYARGREREYFIRLTEGDYGREYVEDRLRLGAVHEEIGLPVRFFLGMYAFYLRQVAALLLNEYADSPERACEAGSPLTDEAAVLRHRARGRHLHQPAGTDDRPSVGGDPRALDTRADPARAAAGAADHRDPRHVAGATADRRPAGEHPGAAGEGGDP
jgi:Protoglobin